MTGPRASTSADTADHPLRAALARGETAYAQSEPALHRLLLASDDVLIAPAVVAQVRGLLTDLSRHLVAAWLGPDAPEPAQDAMLARLTADAELRRHCQALALEWRLAQRLEDELAIDPVLSPLLQDWIGQGDGALGSLAMAALAAQARFAQGQRRMQLTMADLPAELFHAALSAAAEVMASQSASGDTRAAAGLRAAYDEGEGRLALLSRMAREAGSMVAKDLRIEDAGVSLWLSVMAERAGEERDRTIFAAADPHLGRLLLTLRAAGTSPGEAQRQALRLHPDANLPLGLDDVGTREAAQWLADARP